MFDIQPVVLIIDYDDQVMMMLALKGNGGSDDEADSMTFFQQQVKRALKLKLEILVSQILGRLWATFFPRVPLWGWVGESPGNVVGFGIWMACEMIGMGGWVEIK